jgi:hypothetical protein
MSVEAVNPRPPVMSGTLRMTTQKGDLTVTFTTDGHPGRDIDSVMWVLSGDRELHVKLDHGPMLDLNISHTEYVWRR